MPFSKTFRQMKDKYNNYFKNFKGNNKLKLHSKVKMKIKKDYLNNCYKSRKGENENSYRIVKKEI